MDLRALLFEQVQTRRRGVYFALLAIWLTPTTWWAWAYPLEPSGFGPPMAVFVAVPALLLLAATVRPSGLTWLGLSIWAGWFLWRWHVSDIEFISRIPEIKWDPEMKARELSRMPMNTVVRALLAAAILAALWPHGWRRPLA